MIRRPGRIAGVAGSLLVGIVLAAGAAGAQVPPVETPPESSVPATPPPPKDQPAPVPGPSDPPHTVAPDGPGTPAPPPGTPGTAAPTAPADPKAPPATPGGSPAPAQHIERAGPAKFSLDLSQIEQLRRQALGKGPRAAIPDHGFDQSLPFREEAGTAVATFEEVPELGAEEEKIAQVRRAGSIAAGLLALLLVGLAGWVLRQANSGARAIQH